NFCFDYSFPHQRAGEAPLIPWQEHGVHEFPVSIFRDWPGHWRPAQLCACSSGEMEHALDTAERRGWPAFVIVWHSFELIKRLKARPDPIMLRRFRRLCGFLQKHRDRFETRVFSETTA